MSLRVHVPTPLRSYTGKANTVEADGATLAQVLVDLDRRYPGLRFRIVDEQDRLREHIRIFVNREQAPDLSVPLQTGDTIHIITAISGGAGA